MHRHIKCDAAFPSTSPRLLKLMEATGALNLSGADCIVGSSRLGEARHDQQLELGSSASPGPCCLPHVCLLASEQ